VVVVVVVVVTVLNEKNWIWIPVDELVGCVAGCTSRAGCGLPMVSGGGSPAESYPDLSI